MNKGNFFLYILPFYHGMFLQTWLSFLPIFVVYTLPKKFYCRTFLLSFLICKTVFTWFPNSSRHISQILFPLLRLVKVISGQRIKSEEKEVTMTSLVFSLFVYTISGSLIVLRFYFFWKFSMISPLYPLHAGHLLN